MLNMTDKLKNKNPSQYVLKKQNYSVQTWLADISRRSVLNLGWVLPGKAYRETITELSIRMT